MINITENFSMEQSSVEKKTKGIYPLLFGFTWNPNPKSFVYTEDDPNYLLKEHLRYLGIIKDELEYVIPEFSETHKLHYHGVIVLRTEDSYVRFYDRLKRVKRNGFVKLVKIQSLTGWRRYCRETLTRTSKILEIDCQDPNLNVVKLKAFNNKILEDREKDEPEMEKPIVQYKLILDDPDLYL